MFETMKSKFLQIYRFYSECSEYAIIFIQKIEIDIPNIAYMFAASVSHITLASRFSNSKFHKPLYSLLKYSMLQRNAYL